MAEQQQGTEYTLQGVMRFLQIEWHNHERARNTWDIERAEMKAKIAKQEGDWRSAKKLNDLLEKQIRMLEKALKHERAKNKAIAAGEEPPIPTEDEVKKEWNGKIGVKPSESFPGVDLDNEVPEAAEAEREAQRDKSKVFLQKCVEELTYLLTPPSHPLPPQPSQQEYNNAADMAMQDAYLQQQQQQQVPQPRRRNPQLSHLPSLPNHHPQQRSATEYYQPSQQSQHAEPMQRQMAPQASESFPMALADEVQQQPIALRPQDEEVERVTHTFDSYGRSVPETQALDDSRPLIADDANGWNFDDTSTLLETPPEVPPPQRLEGDRFPGANNISTKSPTRTGHGSHRRKSSGASSLQRRRSDGAHEIRDLSSGHGAKGEPANFKQRFVLRGHLDVVRSVIFTGGGTPSEPEICTTGDDGMIKRWTIPAAYGQGVSQQQHADHDIQSYFTHRGHEGIVTSLASCPASASFSTGGRALGDGWIFSGGQDATVRVWERGRVDPKATLDGHTDAVWTVAVLPASAASILGTSEGSGSPSLSTPGAGRDDRILLASGSADHSVKIWAVSAPPQLTSPGHPSGGRRGVGGSRRHSVTSGSGFPSSPQPSTASGTPFHYTMIHNIQWPGASPTCICPLGAGGESFVVSYADSSVLIFDTRTGEEVVGMASGETYDGTPATGVNSVVVTRGNTGGGGDSTTGNANSENDEEGVGHGATGSSKDGGVEGVVISGHEDRFVRFFDANSGQCTYSMLAHPSSIASLSLSPDGRELVSAGHDASLRIWSLEKRTCIQETTSHRLMRGEGVVSAVWSQDGRWVVSGGGDGVVKVFGR